MPTQTIRPEAKRAASKKHFSIYPISPEGFHEIWESVSGADYGPGFDSAEGTFGYLYPLKCGHTVICNQFGRPKMVFDTESEVAAWLQSQADEVEWI